MLYIVKYQDTSTKEKKLHKESNKMTIPLGIYIAFGIVYIKIV